MKILFTTPCKPIPIFLEKFLSIDDVSYRFIVDQGLFSATAEVPCFSLHFLAQNTHASSVVLEWPTFEELENEMQSEHYDYVAISFKALDLYRVDEMIQRVRKIAPDTKVVLGGYGTLAFAEPHFAPIGESADHVCRHGDGVQFLRSLLGDTQRRSVMCHLPVEVIRIPWLAQAASVKAKAAYMLSALGCANQCEFCCTSAYAGGRVIEVMSPEEMFESMQWYYRTHPDLKQIYMMDEEFLFRREKVKALGELIREDEELGLTKMSYLAFGTLASVSQWDPEELLLNGVGEVWSGIESMYSYQHKKGELDSRNVLHALHQHGIESQLSWIVGDDCQTKDNIGADVDNLIAHEPCTVQLSVLSACPGTALYSRLKPEGRVRDYIPEESHLLGNNMDSLHFTHEERVQVIQNTYRRIYETLGPSIMRSARVFMNGYEHCLRSKNPILNGPKLKHFKARIEGYMPLIKVAIEFAPTVQAKQAMNDLRDRYVEIFGRFRKTQEIAGDRFLRLATEEMDRRQREGYSTLRDVPLVRTTYPGR